MKRIGILLIIYLYISFTGLSAQEVRSEVHVDFRVNTVYIDPDYADNARKLAEITSLLHVFLNDTALQMKQVAFCGTASPEGNSVQNKVLAQKRLETLEKLVRSRVQIPDDIIVRDNGYIPWNALDSLVEGSDISRKEEILDILRSQTGYVGEHATDNRISRLRGLDGGRVWQEINRRFFNRMRTASVLFITHKEKQPVVEPDAIAVVEHPVEFVDTFTVPVPVVPVVEAMEVWQRRWYVKTNALGWGLLIANAALEVDLARHWSVALPVYYSSWNYFSSTVKFRTFTVQPEVRYWFSPDNEGWFGGLHLGLGYYNVAIDGEYRTQDRNGTTPSIGGGVSAGYRLPVSRNGRWKMEFSVGAGVYTAHYDRFRNEPHGLLVNTQKRTYYGLDQAAVSLVYAFGCKRKGGVR